MTTKKGVRDLIQGVACAAILFYVMFGDPSRLPVEWLGTVPGGFMTSSRALLAWVSLLCFIEGTKAAAPASGDASSPLERGLAWYVRYWKVCAPLALIGCLFFCEAQNPPLYCPVFENLTPARVIGAVLAVSNGMHEGTWMALSLAISAVFGGLYLKAKGKWGVLPALGVLVADVGLQFVLFRWVIRFTYHDKLFPVVAMAGAAAWAMGLALADIRSVREWGIVRCLAALNENRTFMAVTAPLRFIGRNWLGFWLAQFYLTFYYYNVAASVYSTTLSALGSFAVFLVGTGLLLCALEWGWRRLGMAFGRTKWTLPAILLLLAVPFLLRLALETSMGSYAQFSHVASLQWPVRAMVNVLAIFCLIMIFRALMGRWLPAALTVTVLLTLLGIANHYTMKYHGALLTIEDIHNVQTAAGVIGGYDLSVDAIAGKILLLEGAAVACCILSWLCGRGLKGLFTLRQRWVNRLACLLAAAVALYFCYFSSVPIIERHDNTWSWGSLYAKIGFFSGTVESTLANLSFSVFKPTADYEDRIQRLTEDAQRAQAGTAAPAEAEEPYPDIVMILNETWYDLDQYIDTHADVDYMRNYNALDNAIKGYALVPMTGGGTNGTEYEMLTGNSMTLINAYAPFNRLNLTGTVALPAYLKQLGYSTLGAHPHESQNYHRGMSWPQLGIDQSFFIHDFTDVAYYGDRKQDHQITDTSALENLIRFMDDMPQDGPRFAFLATMQNHGGWDTNPPGEAIVHASLENADAALVNQINEYLSCLTFTDAMIEAMRQYYTQLYQQTGRRVVVCMVGDHSPSILSEMGGLCKWSDPAEAERRGRMTPYFIWANYPLALDGLDLTGTEEMDLCGFMPTVLKAAGIPMSYYYRYICDMNRDIAAYTNVVEQGEDQATRIAFYDREGRLRYIDEDSPLAGRVTDYFCMEYNLNGGEGSFESALFQPMGDAEGG